MPSMSRLKKNNPWKISPHALVEKDGIWVGGEARHGLRLAHLKGRRAGPEVACWEGAVNGRLGIYKYTYVYK